MAFVCAPNSLVSTCRSTSASLGFPTKKTPKSREQIRHQPISIASDFSRQNKSVTERRRGRTIVICNVALEEAEQSIEDIQLKAKVGDKVKVREPLKVYHVPKTPEFDLGGIEGVVKDYVALWKGKRISANLPYKVQFNMEVNGRPIKFFAHLKEDEFDVVA